MSKIYINNLFYLAFSLMFFFRYVGLDESGGELYFLYIAGKISVLLISLLIFFLDLINKKISIGLLMISGFVLFIAIYTGDLFILISFITVLALRDIDIKYLLYWGLFLSVVSIIYTVMATLFRYGVSNVLDYIYDERFGIRLSLGYLHPNAFPYRIFIFLCFYVLVRKRILFGELLFFWGVCYLVYVYTGSRTSFLASLLLLFSVYILQHISLMKIFFIRMGIIFSYSIFTLISICSVIYFQDYDFLSIVNSLSSGRVYDSYRLFQEIGISLFPRNIREFLSVLNSPMDNFYNYTLASSGIVFVILFNIVTIGLFRLMYKFELNKEMMVLCMIGTYAVLEKGILDISLNIFLAYYSFLTYKEKIIFYKKR